jgi:hypothetical protein
MRCGDFKDPFGRFGRGTGFKAPPAGYGDYAFILHIVASLTDDGRAGIVCPRGVLFRGQPELEEGTSVSAWRGRKSAGKRSSWIFMFTTAATLLRAWRSIRVCPYPSSVAIGPQPNWNNK